MLRRNTAAVNRSGSAAREREGQGPRVTVPQEFRLSEAHPSVAKRTIMAEVEAERGRDLTFRPRLRRAASAGPGGRASPAVGATGNRVAQLARPRTDLWLKCAQKKLEEDGAKLQECSFRPAILRRPTTQRAHMASHMAHMPVSERLYHCHDAKHGQWQRLKKEQEDAALQDCTFSPHLNNPDQHLSSYTPIHVRAGDLHRQKREKLAKMAVAAEQTDPNLTFAPALNQRSLRLAQQVRDGEYGDAQEERAASVQLSEEEECTFAPAINPASERLVDCSRSLPSNFFDRQRFFHEARQEKLRNLQASVEDAECTFYPATRTAELAATWARRGMAVPGETYLERVERLACQDLQRVEAARAAQTHLYYSQFTFHPEINPRSKRIGRRMAAPELSRENGARAAREAAARAAEEKLQQECTFQPNLAKAGPHGAENRPPVVPTARLTIHGQAPDSLARHIDKYRVARQKQLEQERARLEAAELAECTFTPAVHHSVPETKGPVVVRGLDRHMELRELARQKEEEQRAREARVFITCPRNPSFSHTVPQPFNLQTETREKETQAERARMRASLAAEAMRECTFAPRTNEGRNRALIQRILAGSDDEDSYTAE